MSESFINSKLGLLQVTNVRFVPEFLSHPTSKEQKKYVMSKMELERQSDVASHYRCTEETDLPAEGITTISAEFPDGKVLMLPSITYDVRSEINTARTLDGHTFTRRFDYTGYYNRKTGEPLNLSMILHGRVDNSVNSLFRLDHAELHVGVDEKVLKAKNKNDPSTIGNQMEHTEQGTKKYSCAMHSVCCGEQSQTELMKKVDEIIRLTMKISEEQAVEVFIVDKHEPKGVGMLYSQCPHCEAKASVYAHSDTFFDNYNRLSEHVTTSVRYYRVGHLSHPIICLCILNLIKRCDKFRGNMLYSSPILAKMLENDEHLMKALNTIYGQSSRLPTVNELMLHTAGLPECIDMTSEEISEFITDSHPIKADFVKLDTIFYSRLEKVNLVNPIGARVTPSSIGTLILSFILRSMVVSWAQDLKARPSIERAVCYCMVKLFGVTHVRFGGTSVNKWEKRPLVSTPGTLTTLEEKDFQISNENIVHLQRDVESLFVFPRNMQMSIYDLGRFIYAAWCSPRDEAQFFSGLYRTVGLDTDLSLCTVNAITNSGMYYANSPKARDIVYAIGFSGPGQIGCTTAIMYLPIFQVAIGIATTHPSSDIVRNCMIDIADAFNDMMKQLVVHVDMLPGEFSTTYEKYKEDCMRFIADHASAEKVENYAIGLQLAEGMRPRLHDQPAVKIPTGVPNRFYSVQTVEYTNDREIMCTLDFTGVQHEIGTGKKKLEVTISHYSISRKDIDISTMVPVEKSKKPPPTSVLSEIKPINVNTIRKELMQSSLSIVVFHSGLRQFFAISQTDHCFIKPFMIYVVVDSGARYYAIAFNGRLFMEGELFDLVYARLVRHMQESGIQPFAGNSNIYGAVMAWYQSFDASTEI